MLRLDEYRARGGAGLPRQGPSGSTGLDVDASGSVQTDTGTGAGTAVGTGTEAGSGTQTDNNQPTNTGGGSSTQQQQTSTQQETSTQSSTQPTSTRATSTAPTSTQPTSSASPTSATSRTSVTEDSTSVPPTSSIPPRTSTEVATRTTQSRTSSVSSPASSASDAAVSRASASSYTTYVTTLSDGRSTTVTSPLPTNLSTSSPNGDSYSRTALIAGVTAGGVVLLALALGAIFIVKRSKKRRVGWIEAMRQHKREGKGAGAVGLLDGEFDDEDDPFVARGGRYRDNNLSGGSGSGGRGTPETEMRSVPSHHYHYQTRQQPGGGMGSQVPQLPVPPGYHTPVSASELSLQSPALGVHGSPFGAGNISNHSRTSIFRTSDSGSIFHEALDDNPNTEDPFKVVYPSPPPPPGITPPPSSYKSPPPVVTISPSSSAPKVTFADAPTHAPRPASPSRVAFIDQTRGASSPSPTKHLGSSPLRVVE